MICVCTCLARHDRSCRAHGTVVLSVLLRVKLHIDPSASRHMDTQPCRSIYNWAILLPEGAVLIFLFPDTKYGNVLKDTRENTCST